LSTDEKSLAVTINEDYEAAISVWKAAIAANPMASADDVQWLGRRDPLAALQHPNCPPDLWWSLALWHPMEAENSPAYPLLTLEEPERWDQVIEQHVDKWLQDGVLHLTEKEQHLLAADCAERVLPLYEAKVPWKDDNRPSEAIRLHRLYAHGEATKRRWEDAADACIMAALHPRIPDIHIQVRNAAQAASCQTAHAAMKAAQSTFLFKTDLAAEKRWQWDRLRLYLRKEV